MKNTIEYQRGVMAKRESLVYAITHNVKYLADIHRKNNSSLRETKDHNERLVHQNRELIAKNKTLEAENSELLADQRELEKKRNQINEMVISSQANAKEIEALQDKNASMAEKMEKLSLEVTVVVTEKLTLKKELARVDALYSKVQKDFKEQRVNFDLLVDEVSTVNKQNAEYRGLILENEEKLGQIAQEIQDLQKHIDLKNKALVRQTEETQVYQKQIDKLLEELRDKSDSESFDDEKEKLLNVEKALEADRLKERLKHFKAEVA